MSHVKIEVVADVVCPWCYLGWGRLKKALESRPGITAEISWRAYQLRPELPAEGADYKKIMMEKFGPQRMADMQANMRKMGKTVGLEFNFDKIEKSPNTNAAHRLIRWAQQEGKLDAVALGVMRAYFAEGKFIGDENVLADIGAAAGMNRDSIIARFKEGAGRDGVAADIAKNAEEGVRAVPYYVIAHAADTPVRVEGSLPYEDLAQEIDRALKQAA